MFLTDISAPEHETLIKECNELLEGIKLGGPDIKDQPRSSSPPDEMRFSRRGRAIYPGKTGIVQSASEYIQRASEILDKMNNPSIKQGHFEAEVYDKVITQLRAIRDKLATYKAQA